MRPAGFWWGPVALLPDRVGASLSPAMDVYNSYSKENNIFSTFKVR